MGNKGKITPQKIMGSMVCLIGGVALVAFALILDFTKSGASYRGALLLIGMVALLAGIYFYPTLKHHRTMVYIVFLFPLLFAFAVTVVIPLVLGIGYSFTDWNGIRLTKNVGFANYISMFKQPQFLWSTVLTFLFVVLNMILVNVVAFLLALLVHQSLRDRASLERLTLSLISLVVSYLDISGSSFSAALLQSGQQHCLETARPCFRIHLQHLPE